jgi:hypothetical protein
MSPGLLPGRKLFFPALIVSVIIVNNHGTNTGIFKRGNIG